MPVHVPPPKDDDETVFSSDHREFLVVPDSAARHDDTPDEDVSKGLDVVPIELDDDEESHYQPQHKPRSCFRNLYSKIVPPGGLIASSFTLGSSTLGAGILGLPAAFSNMGLVSSLLILIVVDILTIFSLWLLARCADATKLRTYEDVARKLLGRGPDYAVALLMCGFCFGGGVSYIVSIGDLLTPIFDDPSVPSFLQTKTGNRLITSLIWLCCILPLCLPKNIDSLRYVSMAGVTFVIFFVFCIVINSCDYMHEHGWRDDIKFFNTGNTAIEGLGTIIFACLVQINAFEVYFEMDKPSPMRMVRNSTVSLGGCGILYIMAGLFGYARFGSTVESSILLMYQPREAHEFWPAYFGIVIKICVAFALHQLPMRDGIYHFLHWDVYKMPWWKNAVFCGILSLVTLIVGLMVPNITVVLGLVGSLCGGFLGFIFPALMIMYTGRWNRKNVGVMEWGTTYFLLITGVIAVVFGTGASIYGVFA